MEQYSSDPFYITEVKTNAIKTHPPVQNELLCLCDTKDAGKLVCKEASHSGISEVRKSVRSQEAQML